MTDTSVDDLKYFAFLCSFNSIFKYPLFFVKGHSIFFTLPVKGKGVNMLLLSAQAFSHM